MSAPGYRADIDGLRAVAIIPVVLFHAGVPGFHGGFVGVDVFFVISGYLITSIIAGEMIDGRFSFASFYERRVRRLAPALLAVAAAVLVIGWSIQTPTDYVALASSVLYTLVFAANFHFAQLGGYFDQPLAAAPMLHAWSLAVEEQFYIVWPPLLWLLLSRLYRWRRPVIYALLLASLVYAIGAIHFEVRGAFYAPHARAWELLVGAVIGLGLVPACRSRAVADAASVTGLGLIALSVFTYTEATPFPGVMAIPPVLGAALVIWAGCSRTALAGRLLATPPLVFVGLISYALYLWHWPLLAFHYGHTGHAPSVWEGVAIVAASFVLAVLTWHFLEKPVRERRAALDRKTLFTMAAAGAGAIAVVAISARATTGFIDRFPAEIRQLTREANKSQLGFQCPKGKLCPINAVGMDARNVLLWGDSHAGAILPAFVDSASATNTGLSTVWRPACPPLFDITASPSRRRAQTCRTANRLAREALASGAFSDVVLVARWNMYLDPVDSFGRPDLSDLRRISDANTTRMSLEENHAVVARSLARTIKAIRDAGARAWIVLSVPNPLVDVPNTMARDLIRGRVPGTGLRDIPTAWHVGNSRAMKDIVTRLAQEHAGSFEVIDPTERFCPADTCLLHIDGRPLYYDASHLSTLGARYAGPLIQPIFDRAGELAGAPK